MTGLLWMTQLNVCQLAERCQAEKILINTKINKSLCESDMSTSQSEGFSQATRVHS